MESANDRLTAEIKASGLTQREWYRTIYLNSGHWAELRARALQKHGRKCHDCPSETRLDVHHLRYRNIYDVTEDDLQILCRECHDLAHGKTPEPPRPSRNRKPKKVKLSKKQRKKARKAKKAAAARAANRLSRKQRFEEWKASHRHYCHQ